MSAELIAILAVGAALCGLLLWEQHRLGLRKYLRDARKERRGARTDRLDGRTDRLDGRIDRLEAEMKEVRDRLSRLEGTMELLLRHVVRRDRARAPAE